MPSPMEIDLDTKSESRFERRGVAVGLPIKLPAAAHSAARSKKVPASGRRQAKVPASESASGVDRIYDCVVALGLYDSAAEPRLAKKISAEVERWEKKHGMSVAAPWAGKPMWESFPMPPPVPAVAVPAAVDHEFERLVKRLRGAA
jgi:hypothetical protein